MHSKILEKQRRTEMGLYLLKIGVILAIFKASEKPLFLRTFHTDI